MTGASIFRNCKMAIVYLICDAANGYFKIGVTRGSIARRMKKLQTGNPTELFLTKCFKTETPFYLEKSLHLHFQSKKVLNEWFALDNDDIKEFIPFCKKTEEVVRVLKDNPFFKAK